MRPDQRLTPGYVGIVVAAIVVVFAIVGVVSAATGGVPSGDVAKVKHAGSISKADFRHWYAVVAAQPQPGQKKPKKPPAPNSAQGKSIKMQVMQFLLSAKWITGEAKERGTTATPEEVKRQFEQTKKQSFKTDKQYKRFLKSSGQSEQDLMFRVQLEVLSTKIRNQVTASTQNVSDSEAQGYYNKNASQFSQPEQRDIEEVVTKTKGKAVEAIKQLKGGQSFAKVAKALSIDQASKQNGGKLLGVTKGTQDPALDAVIFSAIEGKLVGPVKTANGYTVLRVTKIKKGTKQSFAQAKSGIKQLLVSQKQQQKLDTFSKTFRNKWRARTECAKGYVIADCGNGREQTPSTPPTPAVPGQKKPVPGASGANPPALDGSGQTLAGGNGGNPVIQPSSPGAGATPAGLPPGVGAPGATGSSAPTVPLALGGAPPKSAKPGAPTLPPTGVPGATGAPPPAAGGQ